jgi:hypothetical protein
VAAKAVALVTQIPREMKQMMLYEHGCKDRRDNRDERPIR